MGHLYEVWDLYGDPKGSLEIVNMRFWKCMGTLGGHRGHLYSGWEVYGDPWGL